MAKQEHARENLLAEATALVERVDLNVSGIDDHVVVGFRTNGCGSIYFGEQPVYQFNRKNELRRALVGETLFKSQHGRIVALRRRRVNGQLELRRHDLEDREAATFLATMQSRLVQLRRALEAGQFSCNGQVPEGAELIGRAAHWLAELCRGARIATSPRVG